MMLFVGTEKEPADRRVLEVSDEDWSRVVPFLRGGVDGTVVTDLVTNHRCQLRSADCGLGCRCALEITSEWPADAEEVLPSKY